MVFVSATGTHVSYTRFLKDLWKPMLRKAGLRYRRYHALRHTFATRLLTDGAPIQYEQAQLGHATIAQTMDTYAHVQPDRHEHHVAGLDKYIGRGVVTSGPSASRLLLLCLVLSSLPQRR